MEAFIRVMKALSDSNRVKIVKMLQQRTLCVCEIQAALQIAQPTVSKHLKILEKADIICSVKDGLWVNYSLSDGSRSAYAASVLGNLRHWLEDCPQIQEIRRQLPDIRREDVCRRQPNPPIIMPAASD